MIKWLVPYTTTLTLVLHANTEEKTTGIACKHEKKKNRKPKMSSARNLIFLGSFFAKPENKIEVEC